MIRCARGKFTINSFHRALEIVKMLSVSQTTVNRRLVDCGILLSFIKFCPMSYSEVDEIIRNIKGHFPGSGYCVAPGMLCPMEWQVECSRVMCERLFVKR